MRFEIVLAPEAIEDFRRLSAYQRAEVRDAIEEHLRQNPTAASRSRIKQLRGLESPEFRLRVNDVRVFYDVSRGVVDILAIVAKSEASIWLARFGKPK